MPSSRPSWWWRCDLALDGHDQGVRRDLPADLPETDHAAVPRVQAAGVSAFPRSAPALETRERPREVCRLLALRGRVPRGLHPGGRRGEHCREPRLGRRALCAHLRDQHEPLHLLRLLRARVSLRRDHARQRVRDRGVLARRPHLHQGHAPRRADQARSRRGRSALRHARAVVQDGQLMGNVIVWIVWFVAAGACLGTGVAVVSMTNPFYSALSLIGNLASLAVLFLLLSAEFLAAAQVLVYAGAVMVMFLFVVRSEEHTSELQSQSNLVCRLLLEKKKKKNIQEVTKRNNHNANNHDTNYAKQQNTTGLTN